MRNIFFNLTLIGVLFIHFSCGDASNPIARSWQVENIQVSGNGSMPEKKAMEGNDFNKFLQGITYEFRKDGTFEIKMNHSIHRSGKYELKNNNQILVLENKFQVIEYEVITLNSREMRLKLLPGETILNLKAK